MKHCESGVGETLPGGLKWKTDGLKYLGVQFGYKRTVKTVREVMVEKKKEWSGNKWKQVEMAQTTDVL